MWKWYTMLKWWFGYKGRDCAQCGFYEASHYNHDLEFDMECYPCNKFRFTDQKDEAL